MTARNRDLRNFLEVGFADVISQVSNMLAQGAARLAAQRASALAVHAQGGSVSWQSHGCPHRRSRRQAKVSQIIEKFVFDGALSKV